VTTPEQPRNALKTILTVVLSPVTFLLGPATHENVMGWAKIVGAILLIQWLWFQPFAVPSGSMEPTIHGEPNFFAGDRVAVNKHQYGIRVPFLNKLFFKTHDPKRFDIVVFNSPDPKAVHPILVKRLIGLPGERIHIARGKVYVNGEPLELPPGMPNVYYTNPGPDPDQLTQLMNHFRVPENMRASEELRITKEAIESSGTHLTYGILPDDEHSLVPPDHYLMLGDNSSNSADGRVFGWTPRENLIGPVFCIWWPFGHARDFTGFSKTWWGKLLLYGLPAFFVLYEFVGASFLRSWRVSQATPGEPFQKGDRVLVNQAAFGVRLPVLGMRVTQGREPRRGEVVFYFAPDERGTPQLCAGRVNAMPGETVIPEDTEPDVTPCVVPEHHYYMLPPVTESGAKKPVWVAREDLCGSVLAVWWPLGRARRFEEK